MPAVLLQLSLLQMQIACGLGCALMSHWIFAEFLHAFLSAVMQQGKEVLAGIFSMLFKALAVLCRIHYTLRR